MVTSALNREYLYLYVVKPYTQLVTQHICYYGVSDVSISLYFSHPLFKADLTTPVGEVGNGAPGRKERLHRASIYHVKITSRLAPL